MAYCRWSDGDVYVYGDIHDRKGEIRCCACTLRFVSKPAGGVYSEPYPDFIARGPNEMMDHLREHETVGHRVPKYAYTRLRKVAQEQAKKPIKYPVHFLVSKLETIDGGVIDSVAGAVPVCGYHQNAAYRKLLGMKRSENGHAHPRDETTINKKRVTCPECKKRVKAGLDRLPYMGKKQSSTSTT